MVDDTSASGGWWDNGSVVNYLWDNVHPRRWSTIGISRWTVAATAEKRERVVGALGATVTGGTRGTGLRVVGVATLGDGVGAVALVVQNISASCRSA